jgi:cytoskeletal protein RodZ
MMNREEAIRRLSTLTDRQLEVLHEFCVRLGSITRDETLYGPIAEKLYLSKGAVKTHMYNICIKLGIDHLHPIRQKLVFFELYCPVLREVDLPAPPSEPGEPEPLSTEEEEKVDELERAIVSREPNSTVTVEPSKADILPPLQRQEPRRLPWVLLGVAATALVIVGAIAFGVLPLGRGQQTVVVTATPSSEETQVAAVEPQEVTHEATVEVTSGATAVQPTTATTSEMEEATAEPTPIAPTATPVPAATPKPVTMPLPFEDDFKQGPRPEWEVVQGTWRMIDGTYATDDDNRWSYAMVGDPSWQDYAVEVDFTVRCISGYGVAVLLRSSSPGEGMQFEFDCCDMQWVLWENGDSTVVATSDEGVPYYCGSWTESQLRVEAKGSIYTAYLNGVQVLQVQDDTFARGLTGLGSQCDSTDCRIQSFKVVPLP